MATVFLVRDERIGECRAAKVMHCDNLGVAAVTRFRAEVETLRRLTHPGIMSILDDGEEADIPYYIMPYIEGETLRDRLEREGRLSISDALDIAAQIAAAIECAHRAGVVHRDLKPENILMSSDRVVVADFGIAFVESTGSSRITMAGASVGSPLYMSPEQAAGDETVDSRSDVYSIAVLLYEMLTGIVPHSGGTTRTILARILTVEPRPVAELRDVPESISLAISRGLTKAPEERFATAAELGMAIVGALA